LCAGCGTFLPPTRLGQKLWGWLCFAVPGIYFSSFLAPPWKDSAFLIFFSTERKGWGSDALTQDGGVIFFFCCCLYNIQFLNLVSPSRRSVRADLEIRHSIYCQSYLPGYRSGSDRNLSRRLFNLLLGSADGCTTTATTITTITIRIIRSYYNFVLPLFLCARALVVW